MHYYWDIYFTDPCDKSITNANPLVLDVSDNLLITHSTYMYDDLILLDGAVLTIYRELLMPEGSRIIVHPGAKLILEGKKTIAPQLTKATITSCQGQWEGITVLDSPKSPNGPGMVITKNFATIENAKVGITNHITPIGGGINLQNPWPNFGSAVIQCSETTFLNCDIGVNFLPSANVDSCFEDYTFDK